MRNKGKRLIILGLLLIVSALVLTLYNLSDEWRARQSALQAVSILEERLPIKTWNGADAENAETPAGDEQTTIPDHILNPKMDMPVETVDGVDYIGILSIPALGLELPVISQWSYPNLKTAPCRYSGSAYLDDLIICGHNYSAHFGNLKSLLPGDEVIFTDMDGNKFRYRLAGQETLQPTAIEEMDSGDWDLTLFTCTVGGQSRVTLRFEREE